MLKEEFASVEPDFALTLTRRKESSEAVLKKEALTALTNLLVHLPAGIQRMMPDFPDMVQTSLNLGVLKLDQSEVKLTYSVRSSVASERDWLIKKMVSLTELLGGHCEISGVYPAWEYKQESKIRDLIAGAFSDLFGEEPILESIHAGVECGILCEKIPGLDCVSFGPQMHDIHTTREKLSISSVERNWKLLLEVLKRMK